MKLTSNKLYTYKELKMFLRACPICGSSSDITLWSTVSGAYINAGKEGISCNRCELDLSFTFRMHDNEIIDEFTLDFFKIGKLEFKNNNKQLTMYMNNTYVRDIDNNTVDIDKCKKIAILS